MESSPSEIPELPEIEMQTITLVDGTYHYIRPAMGPRDATVTAVVEQGQITSGTYNGQPMTGSCWRACTLADLRTLPSEFTPAPRPIGKARALRMHRALSTAGYRTNHYDLASGVLGREVHHLRDLTEDEARAVWAALTQPAAA